MEFKQLVDAAEKWCSGNPFELIFAEEVDERRMDFYAEPGISFYVLCPDNMTGGTDTFVSTEKNAVARACVSVCVREGEGRRVQRECVGLSMILHGRVESLN